jgi:UDP-N-acetylmuramoyl-tripeptide--D-alanyl-D-alanine ligase
MIAAILGHMGPTFATRGNLNNHIGVPLSLLELSDAYRYAVIEMGANHHGEIAYLTSLARPTVALVNNAGAAHLEGFGSIQGVAWAKGEIYAGLREGGTAVINADDDYAPYWRQINHARRVLSFGASAPADVQVEALGDGRIGLRTPRGELELQLPLAGSHNALNAAAATACALAAGADLQAVRAGLEGLSPVAGRLQPRAGVGGMALIDDSYNANPGSLRAAMEVLAALPGRRWLVLGAMGELGADTEAAHRAAGEQARALGLDRVLSLGSDARAAAVAFGVADDAFDSAEALASRIRAAAAADLTVLVKGSRSAHMERVVEALLPDAGSDSDSGAEEATCS